MNSAHGGKTFMQSRFGPLSENNDVIGHARVTRVNNNFEVYLKKLKAHACFVRVVFVCPMLFKNKMQ